MRIVFCFVLVMVCVLMLSVGALAVQEDAVSEKVQTMELEAEDIERSASQVIPVTTGKNFRGGVLREFSLEKKAVSDRQALTLDEKCDFALYLENCTWSPAEGDLALGLYNRDTGILTYRTLSGGEIKDQVLEFEAMDSGDYWLVVLGLSEEALTDGTVRYSFG